jgi:hypothetical protein
MPQKVTPIKRRIAPSVPLKLDLEDDSGAKFSREFRLSFDLNAAARIQLRMARRIREEIDEEVEEEIDGKKVKKMVTRMVTHDVPGPNLGDPAIWSRIVREPVCKGVVFWASVLAHHPEYDSDEGFECIQSYLDDDNEDVVIEALWDAHIFYVSKAKREYMIQWKANAEKRRQEATERPTMPATPNATPEEIATKTGSNSGPSPDTTSASLKASSAS